MKYGIIAVLTLFLGCSLAGKHRGHLYKSIRIFPVTVDCSLTTETLIDLGRYNSFDKEINNETFPIDCIGTKEVLMKIVRIGKLADSEEVLRELDGMGLRPATIHELLAFGAAYPDEQRKDSIIGLGSESQRMTPHLFGYFGENGGWRQLLLSYELEIWPDSYWFSAVSKQ